jgi:hypothetical protein
LPLGSAIDGDISTGLFWIKVRWLKRIAGKFDGCRFRDKRKLKGKSFVFSNEKTELPNVSKIVARKTEINKELPPNLLIHG